MSNLSFKKGLEANLPSQLDNGTFYVVEDTKKVIIDGITLQDGDNLKAEVEETLSDYTPLVDFNEEHEARVAREEEIADEVAYLKEEVEKSEKVVAAALTDLHDTKQDELIDGVNIKTINGESLLGGGDITIDLDLFLVVSELPTENINPNKIYLVQNENSETGNEYIEYMYVESSQQWEEVGKYTTAIDLTPYALSADVETSINSLNDSVNTIETTLTNKLNAEISARQKDVEDINKAIEENELVTITALTDLEERKLDKMDLPNFDAYATEEWVEEQIANINVGGGGSGDVNLDGYATEEWVENKGYITSAALNDYALSADVETAINEVKDIIIDNKEVIAAALTDLEDRKLDRIELPSLDGYATEQWVEDKGYLTDHQDISGKQDVITDLDIIRSGASLGATALQSVPSEYVTETELNAKGYITDAYSKAEVDNKVSSLNTNKQDKLISGTNIKTINGESILGNGDITIDLDLFLVVSELPTTDINPNKIYLIHNADSEADNEYIEYVYMESTQKWEEIGKYKADIDLADYATKTWVNDEYLSISGGTINGNVVLNGNITITRDSSPLYLNVTSEAYPSAVYFFKNLINYGGLGMTDKNTPCFFDTNNTSRPLLHAGNVGEYALPVTQGVVNGDIVLDNKKHIMVKSTNGDVLSAMYMSQNNNLVIGYGTGVDDKNKTILFGKQIEFRSADSTTPTLLLDGDNNATFVGNITAPKFTGDLVGNADSATKLANKVSLWGNDFDGSNSLLTNDITVKYNNDSTRKTVISGSGIGLYGSDIGGWAMGINSYSSSGDSYGSMSGAYGDQNGLKYLYYGGGYSEGAHAMRLYDANHNYKAIFTGNVTAPKFIGDLEGNADSATKVATQITSAAEHYPLLFGSSTTADSAMTNGLSSIYKNSTNKVYFIPSEGKLAAPKMSATSFIGNLVGNADSATNADKLASLGSNRYYHSYSPINNTHDLAKLSIGSHDIYDERGGANLAPTTYASLNVLGDGYYSTQLCVKNNASSAYLRGITRGTTVEASEWHQLAFIDSNVASATKATQDSDGNAINTTYLKKSGGTISSSSAPLTINRQLNGDGYSSISYSVNGSLVGVLGFNKNGIPVVSPERATNSEYHVIVHAGNYTLYQVDTKDTAGSTNDTSNKLFIVGAKTQGANPQTYSNANVYISNSKVYANDFDTTSDARLKDFVSDVDVDFNELKSIPKKYYYWKDKSMGENLQLGTSAQELAKVYPECVSYNETEDRYSVNYQKLSIIALAAIDKLHERISVLEEKLNEKK